jgi:enoyl-CoA hydratase
MSDSHLLVETRDRVLYATLNRPEKHNALSLSLLADLLALFEDQAGDETLLAAVLTGTGDKTFAAGGDLRELAALRTEAEAEQMARDAKAALNAIRDFPVPVIAALNGNTFGGAAELSVACDFRVAAAHARIGFVQGRLAVSTAWGGGPDVLQLLGRAKGLRLMVTGEMVSSDAALGMGLVDKVAGEGESLADAVEEFLEPMRKQAPQVMRVFKALGQAHRRGESRDTMQEIETKLFVGTWVHDDHWVAAEKVLPSRK